MKRRTFLQKLSSVVAGLLSTSVVTADENGIVSVDLTELEDTALNPRVYPNSGHVITCVDNKGMATSEVFKATGTFVVPPDVDNISIRSIIDLDNIIICGGGSYHNPKLELSKKQRMSHGTR